MKSEIYGRPGAHRWIIAGLLMIGLTGCGGTKVLKEAAPITSVAPLAIAGDGSIDVVLDWVIVRDGPGTWARNADWDEYMLRVRNRSDAAVQITGIAVYDAMDVRTGPESSRSELVKASKEVTRRYKGEGLKVKAGRGSATMVTAGATALVTVGALAPAVAFSGGAAVGAAAVATLAAAPVLIVGGVVRGVNNGKVAREIESRHSDMPIDIAPGDEQSLTAFFPLAPSPSRIEFTYRDAGGENVIYVDTHDVLKGLHIGTQQ